VVFDLDGTLIDSRGDIAASCNHALAAVGRPQLTLPEVSALVGDGARPLLARAARMPESHPEVDVLMGHFLGYYQAHPIDFTTLLPHVHTTLAALLGKGFRLALCTNKPRVTTDEVVRRLDLSRLFEAIVAGDDLAEKKPHPAQIHALATTLQLKPEELVMVGDGPQDVLAGRAAGSRTVALKGGFLPWERVEAARPDVAIDDLLALLPVVEGWASSMQ